MMYENENNASVLPIVNAEAFLHASVDDVFRVWTDPEELRSWWGGPNGMTPCLAEVDLRPGGRFRFGMQSEKGRQYISSGEYLAIDPPQKLVFTWRWEHSDEEFPTGKVTVEFKEADGGCLILVTHENLPDLQQAANHEGGWWACLRQLVDYLN